MKKRFVAKQVGVLSLTAVLAGMPAVNVLAEDVYQEKVGEVQTEAEKALLRAALNVSFVTEYGENVGNTYVESDLLWPWDSYTFKLGTDYNLLEGWELVGTAEDKTVKCGETASVEILVKPVAAETVTTRATINFKTIYGEEVGKTVAETTATGEGDWTFMLGTDYQLPEGWQLATRVEQTTNLAVPFGTTVEYTVVVEPVAGAVTETKLNIIFETVHGEKVGETVAKTTATGEGDWTFMLGTDYQLPEGWQLAAGVDQVTNIQVPFGATAGHTMIVEKNTETPDKLDPENPEKPNPENPEKPNQDNTNNDDGKTQDKDKKTENKAKTPKTGDDLQAAGTFSILGAGALAAIAALLKKRK